MCFDAADMNLDRKEHRGVPPITMGTIGGVGNMDLYVCIDGF